MLLVSIILLEVPNQTETQERDEEGLRAVAALFKQLPSHLAS